MRLFKHKIEAPQEDESDYEEESGLANLNETLLQAEPIPESDLFLNLNEENEEEVETLNTISEEVDLFYDEIHEVIDFANNLSFTSVVKLAKSTT